ncbi:MAG: hypothetical protein RLZZ445_2924 [Pseudomonadota bacterium]|jgi:ankyrin repeat protein
MRKPLFCMIAMLPGLAIAQIPPSAAEVACYSGLHATAYKGDMTEIERLIATKANLNARDPYGRTPQHVATHAGKVNAIRALAISGSSNS